MTKKELFDLLQSVEVTPEQTESPVITITKSQYLKLVYTLDQHSNRIGILVDILSKLGKLSVEKRSKINTVVTLAGMKNVITEYDTVIQQMLVVSNQINRQYNLMVTSVVEVIEGNG